VEARLSPNVRGILQEMGVQVWFLEPPREDADAPAAAVVWVPQGAVRNSGTGAEHVFVVRDGRAERRAVRTGQRRGGEVEVTAGLAGGDVVVTRAQGELSDGARVRM
jgi:hypothetical protein